MLDVKNLTVTFNDDHPAEAVRGINLHMEDGETLGLVGESGSGKTVTAMTIAGLLANDSAEINGEVIDKDGTAKAIKRLLADYDARRS